MNISNSECSGGCESGWTMYLDQISNSTDNNNPYTRRDFGISYKGTEIDQDDEDLSMVSDASSGPPHYSHASLVSEDVMKNKQKKYKSKETKIHHKQQQSLCLDDTASSPVFNFPLHQDNVAPSDNQQVLNAANFEGESVTKKHLGFFKSSTKEKSGGNFLGRKRQ